MLHRRFILRQITRSPGQSLLLALGLALAVASLVALSGLSAGVRRALNADARRLHGADILVRSSAPLGAPLIAAISRLEGSGAVTAVAVHEFNALVRRADETASLLCNLKVVDPGYPFYGEVTLASGRSFGAVLSPGSVVVERDLLERLRLNTGDPLHIGSALLTIDDVVLHEPDRPLGAFSLGPRVFVTGADLAALALVETGSRVSFRRLLKVLPPGGDPDLLAAELKVVAEGERERVETYRSADSRVKRFFDNFIFYLSLVGAFTLLIAGLGVGSTLGALLREKRRTIAILKALGATGGFVIRHFLVVLLLIGLVGSLAGLLLGLTVQAVLSVLLQEGLSLPLPVTLTAEALWTSLGLGLLVIGFFGTLPLLRLRATPPAAILRFDAPIPRRSVAFWIICFLVLVLAAVMLRFMLADAATWGRFALGSMLALGGLALLSQVLLRGCRRQRRGPLALRQALRSLGRPGSAAATILTTLSAAMAAVFALYLVERNLDATFVRSYPADVPNLFFLDIQPHQRETFSRIVGQSPRFYPVVRARLLALNGQTVDRDREHRRRGDNLARDFNLTYRDDLLEDEVLRQGISLFGAAVPVPVSVLDEAPGMENLRLGDTLTFRIQGLPVEATVTSIRSRTRETLQPFFYFVLPETVIGRAPQTIFTALKIPPGQGVALQSRVAAALPNVSAIDLGETLRSFSGLLSRLSAILRLFGGFSVMAGLLIVVSAVLATGGARIREAVYYRILGARGRFVLAVFGLENLLLGLASALAAMALAQTVTWLISRRLLDLPYQVFWAESALMVTAGTAMVVAVGLGASLPVLHQRPSDFLQAQAEGE
jgi:putative ABC transport system permease protein